MSSNVRTVNYSQGEKLEQQIPLSDVLMSQNPRKELRGALEKFHELGTAQNTPEQRAEFVKFIDENFPYVRDRLNSYQTIVIDKPRGQIQAVTLRRYDSKGENKYGIVQGECRVLAWALLEAETGEPQKVRAVVAPKMTLDEAFDIAITENIDREEMSPLDIGYSFQEMLTVRINTQTVKEKLPDGSDNPNYSPAYPKGRPYKLQEIATKFRKDYNWVRGRAALPYLSEKDKLQMMAEFKAGKRNITRYITKALELAKKAKQEGKGLSELTENSGENPVDVSENSGTIVVVAEKRRRVLTLKQVVNLFDATPTSNVERLKALAEVMGLDYDNALAERLVREKEQAQLDAARQVEADHKTLTQQQPAA